MTSHTPDWPSAAAFMGPAYLRYSFTKGSEQEAAFLTTELRLGAGTKLLDLGCGPGRHARLLSASGVDVTGVDISPAFVDLARAAAPAATFVVGDARELPYEAEFDVVVSLCEGGFGLVGDRDYTVLANMARACKPGGLVALTAFSAYFAVRFPEEGQHFDAAEGVQREVATIRNEAGDEAEFPIATSCFTPRELALLVEKVGLELHGLWSVWPGRYGREPPGLESPEYLVVARRPGAGPDSG